MPTITVPITIRDLTPEDLEEIGWSGSACHLTAVRAELGRVDSGEAEYLVACAPSGLPVGKLGIDYTKRAEAGLIHQAAVHGALQSCGIGTLLMAEAERRIRARGRVHAELGVEHDNPRARALYERLGYVAYGEEPAEWDAEGEDGALFRYRTVCTMLRKPLCD